MWSLIQGDKSDEERDDPQSKRSGLIEVEDEDLVDAWDGDEEDLGAFGVRVWVWDGEGRGEGYFFGGMKKKGKEM